MGPPGPVTHPGQRSAPSCPWKRVQAGARQVTETAHTRSSPCPSKEASKQQARQAGLMAHQPSLCWGFHRDGEVYILVWPTQPQCE